MAGSGSGGEASYSPVHTAGPGLREALAADARLYWRVAVLGFRRHAAYLGATWGGLATNTVFGFLRAYVFIAVYREIGTVGDLDLRDALTYTFLTQSTIMLINLWTLGELPARIRTGDVVVDLYRPVRFMVWSLADDYGRAAYQTLFRGIPPFVIGAIFFELRLPERPVTWLLFAASCALAVGGSFALRFMLSLSAFWLLDHRGVQRLYMAATTFLSGFVVPVAFFPEPFRSWARLLPFPVFVELPIRVFLEKEALGALAFQAFWMAVLLVGAKLVLLAGTRKLVVQGG